MSEETQVEEDVLPVKSKKYLLMVDELSLVFLSKIIPSIQFCEVEGMSMEGNPGYQLLANPMKQEVSE